MNTTSGNKIITTRIRPIASFIGKRTLNGISPNAFMGNPQMHSFIFRILVYKVGEVRLPRIRFTRHALDEKDGDDDNQVDMWCFPQH